MALFDGFGRLNVGGGQALLKIEHEERAELATHDGYGFTKPLGALPSKQYSSDSDL